MSFQLKNPSIPAIRAKFLINKLCDFPKTVASINLWATGRTGSGKTTLGNRLVGIDYFMPSTGKQDCTDEVNLVEFPIGLKYIDLPGVCSDDRLDNYNRAALGIKQIENFSVVEELTLAKYSQGKEGKTVQKQSFTVSDFRKIQLEPDLILYLIAPDKQFLSVDCSYLRDLLKHYRQVICVFNMFADKETGGVAAATEQNIIDTATRIKKVYASALGSNSQPIIVSVDCWTGEGISDLLAGSYEVLGSEKGRIFEELIQYQQQKTPDEYLRQTKRELLRLFAHGACQKPEGTYTCDQPLHKDCHTLLNFLADLRVKSEQTSYQFGEKVNSLVSQVLAASPGKPQQVSDSLENAFKSLQIGLNSLQYRIDYLNEAINTRLVESQREAIESRDQEIQSIEKEIQTRAEAINSIEQEIKSRAERHDSLVEAINSLEEEIKSCAERHDSLVDDFNSLNQKIGSRIDRHNSNVQAFNSFVIEISNRINRYESRVAKWEARVEGYNSSIRRIISNPSSFVSQSTINSLELEKNSIEREESSIDSEKSSIEEKIRQRDKKAKAIESEENSIQQMSERREEIQIDIEYEKSLIEEMRKSALEKFKLIQSEIAAIQDRKRAGLEKCKFFVEAVELSKEVIRRFEEEFGTIKTEIDSSIDDINYRQEIISLHLLLDGDKEIESFEEFTCFQEEVNSCIKQMESFKENINLFQEEIKSCVARMQINRLVSEVIMQCTTHHFDNVGECEYRGSTYHYFSQHGLILLLTLAHLIISGRNIQTDYRSLYRSISRRVSNLGSFPSNPTEGEVIRLLESKINLLFDASFDEAVRKVAL